MSVAESITRARGGKWHGHGGAYPGPGHSKRDRSMTIRDKPGGGVILHSFTGDDVFAEKDRLRAEGLLADGFGQRHPQEPAAAPVAAPERLTAASGSGNKAVALKLWSEAVDARGTLAEVYLNNRRLQLPWHAIDFARFHPACPFGGAKHPCLVTLFREIDGMAPCAIHRTALTPDGAKIDRMMLGPVKGAAIMIDEEHGGCEHPLGIAEGLETALAARAMGWSPMWALGSKTAFEAMPILRYVNLMIFADHDTGGGGQLAAINLQRRWKASGQKAFVQTPNEPGDFNSMTGAR